MAKRVLSILESAYRATLEEQDDTVVWLAHAMRGAGAELTLVLRGAAVCYAARGQDASGLSFGERRQTQPPCVAGELARLAGKGVEVLVIEEDALARGISRGDLIEGVKPAPHAALAELCAAHDLVWHW